MKRIINIFSLIILTVILSSCFSSSDDISKVKEWILSWDTNEETTSKWDKSTTSKVEDEWDKYDENMKKFEDAEKQEIEKIKYSVKYLTDEKFLTIDDLENEDFLDWEIEVTWTTLIPNVEKITVNFINVESEYPEDNYTLWKFSSWDDTFLYRAFSEYETLDNGVNKYIIEF